MFKQIENFLNIYFRGTQGNIELRAIPPDNPPVARIFTRSMQEIEIFVSAHMSYANIYFGVCTRMPGHATGTKEDVYETVGCWGDMDFKDYGQEKGQPIDLKKGEDAARKILSEFQTPPSAIIQTGGGLHVYWLFSSPELVKIANMEPVLKGVCHLLKSDRSTTEIARVLRLPFTTNFPNKKKLVAGGRTGPLPATVEYLSDTRYVSKEFCDYYKSKEVSEKKNPTKKQKNEIIPFENVEEKLKRHLKKDFVLQATWQGDRTDYSDHSRSGHDMGLSNHLAKIGFTPEETKAVLKKFPHGKGKDGTESYFDLTVSKAFASRNKDVELKENPWDFCQDSESSAILDKIYSDLNKVPHLVEMSEIEESEPLFLVEPYILSDAVTLLAGDGGGGKSQIGLAYAAKVSQEGSV